MTQHQSTKQTVEQILQKKGRTSDQLIPILQAIQHEFRYLPQQALEYLSEATDISPSQISGVATFYTQFRQQPVGKHIISICTGTACHVKGADAIYNSFKRHLDISDKADTSADGKYTICKVGCLGCCMLAPAIRIDETTYGYLTPQTVAATLKDFEHSQKHAPEILPSINSPAKGEVQICLCSSCRASGAEEVYQHLIRAVRKNRLSVRIKETGCDGLSILAPSIRITDAASKTHLYKNLTANDVENLLLLHFKPRLLRHLFCKARQIVDQLITDETSGLIERKTVAKNSEEIIEFSHPQTRIATEDIWKHDPLDLKEYCANKGFSALEQSVKQSSPSSLLEIIRQSGLRGRGGGGFPTADKMQAVIDATRNDKIIVCNGDEGDPGAFMDRMLLESCPLRIIEGITLAALITGAENGILYIRAEYPLAVERIRQAIDTCEKAGILGDHIFGTSFRFHLKVMEGAGAFVCGEETALLASIEGRRGMPRLRPPYPSQSGLHGKPTLINNVETCALIPWIIRNGAEAFRAIGTTQSTGTKVFSLAGKVKRGGLIEVPMGTTLRTIVNEIGGGVPDDHKVKAVQIGGPSGGCIPFSLANTPVDYESLTAQGVIMGSGGIVVLDEQDCMVEIARYFLEFTQDESCGRCAPCRVGTKKMLDILEAICKGEASSVDLKKLEHLADMVSKSSLCGLGQSAPNPVLSTLRHFREEYEAHLKGRCPAGKCTNLISYHITDQCIGCTLCAQHCPVSAIEFNPYAQHEIDLEKCIKCGNCKNICPEQAVEVRSPCQS